MDGIGSATPVTGPDGQERRPAYGLALAAVLLVALVTRLVTIDASPTYDTYLTYTETEATSLETLRRYVTLEYARDPELVRPELLAESPHLTFPGYYALNKVYIALLPVVSHTAVRALPALFSLLSVVLLVIVAARHIGREGALVAGIVATLSPLLQYHGSYIRFYAALIFFSAWALLAVLALTEGRRFPPPGRRRLLRLAGVSVLLWTPLLVHASGALAVFVCGVALLLRVLPRLSGPERLYALGLNAVLGTPPLVNGAVFVFSRASSSELMPQMSTSALSFLASLIFNFNGLIFLAIAFVLLYCRAGLRLYLYLPFAVALALTFAAVLLEPSLFRPDYLLSLLPLTYFLFADSVRRIGDSLGGTPFARRTAHLLVAAVLAFSLPSFVSNVWIDQDRMDYRLALSDLERITAGQRTLVYSHSPGSFPEALPPNLRVAHLREEGRIEEGEFERVLYLIGWRREGFRKRFLANVETSGIQARAHLVHISGRNRLDSRDNLLFFFEKPRAAHPR